MKQFEGVISSSIFVYSNHAKGQSCPKLLMRELKDMMSRGSCLNSQLSNIYI